MLNIFQFFSSLHLIIIIIICFLIKRLMISSPSRKNPPSPPKLPIIGNLRQLGRSPHRSLFSLAHRHGPLMLLHFGSKPVIIVSSSESAREITKTHDLIFASRPKVRNTEKLTYGSTSVLGSPYGEHWRTTKSLVVLHLLNKKRVESFRDVREEEVGKLIEKLSSMEAAGEEANLSEMFFAFTTAVTCRVAFGKKYGGEMLYKLLMEHGRLLLFNYTVGDFVPWLSWVNFFNGLDGRVRKIAVEVDEILDEIVQEHIDNQQSRNPNDIGKEMDYVDVLLQLQDETSHQFSLDRESIKAAILDIFTAGGAISIALESAMRELIRHPEAMKELQNEVRKVGQDKGVISEADLGKLDYLKMVFKETLRLNPPDPIIFPRECTQDVKVMGYDIPAGAMVIINAWAIGRDPGNWSRPDEFLPERFFNSSIDYKGHSFEMIPFGAGRRQCPGIQFQEVINELALANLVNKFEWALPDGAKLAAGEEEPLIAVATPCSF